MNNTPEEILKNKSQGKPDYSLGDPHLTYRKDAVLLAMKEYGRQERDKALEFLAHDPRCKITREGLEKLKTHPYLAI